MKADIKVFVTCRLSVCPSGWWLVFTLRGPKVIH